MSPCWLVTWVEVVVLGSWQVGCASACGCVGVSWANEALGEGCINLEGTSHIGWPTEGTVEATDPSCSWAETCTSGGAGTDSNLECLEICMRAVCAMAAAGALGASHVGWAAAGGWWSDGRPRGVDAGL